VWVCSSGEPSEETPCGLKDNVILNVVYDKQPLYLIGMKHFNQM
jgi:hypothetical protein